MTSGYQRKGLLLKFFFTVPTGFPRNIEAVFLTSTSIVLHWDPPLPDEQNGVITHYSFNLTSADMRETYQSILNASTVEMDNLSPFTIYLCVIAAGTNIGTGPFSPVYTLQTLEDGM